MISIKNSDAKKVCQVDPRSRTVEIVHKGCRTTITFLENGTYKVTNTILKGSSCTMRARLLNFLFGEKVGVIILTPGETVENVEIKEIGGET